jgi:hypothetical protein
MSKIKYAETYLFDDDLEKLKEKTGEDTTKEALSKAIHHYIECEFIKDKKVAKR